MLIKLCSGRKSGAMLSTNAKSCSHLKMSYVEPHKALTTGQGPNYRVLPDQPQPTTSDTTKRFANVRLPPEIIVKTRPVTEQPELGGEGGGLREKGRREITSWV